MLKTETYKVKTMCGLHLRDKKKAKNLMQMLGLNEETADQLAMTNSAHWQRYVLKRG